MLLQATFPHRDVVEGVIEDWNRHGNAQARNVVLLPLRWEIDAVPEMYTGDAQQVINDQLVNNADLVYAFFHTRLGMATRRNISGTAEELEKAKENGATVRVWFCESELPYELQIEQFASMKAYRQTLQKDGLLGSYVSTSDLASKIRWALEYDVQQFQLQQTAPLAIGTEDDDPGLDDEQSLAEDSGLALPPKVDSDGSGILWPPSMLKELRESRVVSLQRTVQVLDLLTSEPDRYFSTSEICERLGVERLKLRGALSGLSRYVRNRHIDLDGQWPFNWEWGPAIVDGLQHPAETHYYATPYQAEAWSSAVDNISATAGI